ncbi:hypothetical protein BS17DRAFT_278005 [Gyrodon lividus]|nr:hypothetical protein BS17DRAFT_278005 [Gyrodon lividus]
MSRDRSTAAVPANQGEGSTGPQNPAAVQPLLPVHIGAGTPQPEHVQIIIPDSRNSANTGDLDARLQSSSTLDRHLPVGSEGISAFMRSQDNPYADLGRFPSPAAARSRDGHPRGLSRGAAASLQAGRNTSGMSPDDEKEQTSRTVSERMKQTITDAGNEKKKYAWKALWTSYAINIAIGLQVFLGALTTAIPAAFTSAKQYVKKAQIATSVLGGASTMVASYLARVRGSNEPELSITRVKDLDQFLREANAFKDDHSDEHGTAKNDLDQRIQEFRDRLEALLGNAIGDKNISSAGANP